MTSPQRRDTIKVRQRAAKVDPNRAMGSGFASEDFSTVGGLIFGSLGRAPKVGDEISLDGYLLTVVEVDGARIARVVAQKEPA